MWSTLSPSHRQKWNATDLLLSIGWEVNHSRQVSQAGLQSISHRMSVGGQKKKSSVTHWLLVTNDAWLDCLSKTKMQCDSLTVGHGMRHDDAAWQKKKWSITHLLLEIWWDSLEKEKMKCHSHSVCCEVMVKEICNVTHKLLSTVGDTMRLPSKRKI